MNSQEKGFERRNNSLKSNIEYWTKHLNKDKDAKSELARCKSLLVKLEKDIKEYEEKKND